MSDAKGWDGIFSKVRAKANVQLSRTFVLFKNIFRSLCDLFRHTGQNVEKSEKKGEQEENDQTERRNEKVGIRKFGYIQYGTSWNWGGSEM